MTFRFSREENFDNEEHHFRILEPEAGSGWEEEVAREYVRLRRQTVVPVKDIKFDGIEGFSTENIERILSEATIPAMAEGNFNVVRSDLGK